MQKIYLFAFILFMASCSPKIRYVGQQHNPVKETDVYVSASSIKKNYSVIGKGYLKRLTVFSNPEKIQRKAIEKGKAVGADAVLVTDYYIPDTGGTIISTTNTTDSVGKGTVTTGSTVIRPTSASGFSILFIKYER